MIAINEDMSIQDFLVLVDLISYEFTSIYVGSFNWSTYGSDITDATALKVAKLRAQLHTLQTILPCIKARSVQEAEFPGRAARKFDDAHFDAAFILLQECLSEIWPMMKDWVESKSK